MGLSAVLAFGLCAEVMGFTAPFFETALAQSPTELRFVVEAKHVRIGDVTKEINEECSVLYSPAIFVGQSAVGYFDVGLYGHVRPKNIAFETDNFLFGPCVRQQRFNRSFYADAQFTNNDWRFSMIDETETDVEGTQGPSFRRSLYRSELEPGIIKFQENITALDCGSASADFWAALAEIRVTLSVRIKNII